MKMKMNMKIKMKMKMKEKHAHPSSPGPSEFTSALKYCNKIVNNSKLRFLTAI